MNFAFNHRHARAFGSVVDGKNSSRNRNAGVSSIDEKMLAILFRSFNDDVAAFEMNRCALRVSRD